MKLLKPILILGFASLLVFACKKKEEVKDTNNNNNPGNKTALQLLTQKNWKVSALVTSGTDIWSTFLVDNCNKDNEYLFKSNDSVTLYDKALKCNVSDPDSSNSYYSFYNNNTQLILNIKLTSANTLNDTAEIIELNENSLKIDAQYSGVPATISFQHP